MAPPPAPPQPLPEQLQPRGAPQQAPVPPAPATALSPVSQSASDMTTVSTPKEFQDAIVRGVRDIEIRAHLDMRASQRLLNPDMDRTGNEAFSKLSLLYAGQGLRSIRVRPKSQPMTWQNLTCDMQMPASTWHAACAKLTVGNEHPHRARTQSLLQAQPGVLPSGLQASVRHLYHHEWPIITLSAARRPW